MALTYRTKHRSETTDFKIVTRGWLDVRNRDSAAGPSPVGESREYRLRWAMQPQDYVVEKGHRLGVVRRCMSAVRAGLWRVRTVCRKEEGNS
ncbi:CocE/NonD family hydrolase C-terminal non-catalytic domain-containing protein [Streptomyces massasporeus]